MDDKLLFGEEAKEQLEKFVPTTVEINLNGNLVVISWRRFTELLSCAHAFETNYFPRNYRVGQVEINVT